MPVPLFTGVFNSTVRLLEETSSYVTVSSSIVVDNGRRTRIVCSIDFHPISASAKLVDLVFLLGKIEMKEKAFFFIDGGGTCYSSSNTQVVNSGIPGSSMIWKSLFDVCSIESSGRADDSAAM
jgi:hypothetical protein